MAAREPVVTNADRFIYAALAADTELMALIGGTGHIKADFAPPKLTHPFVLFANLSAGGTDVSTTDTGGAAIFGGSTYLIRGVDQSNSFAGLEPIAARISAIFQAHHEGAAGDGYVYSMVRT